MLLLASRLSAEAVLPVLPIFVYWLYVFRRRLFYTSVFASYPFRFAPLPLSQHSDVKCGAVRPSPRETVTPKER